MKTYGVATMRIRVTARHIKEGTPGESDSCPIALAIQEQTGCRVVDVDSDSVTVDGVSLRLGKGVGKFVNRFDGNKVVRPCVFEFGVPLCGG
jgi:hypothetical protein